MECILLTYPEFFKDEASILNALMNCYDFTLHLRKPNATDNAYERILNNISVEFHHRIVLHGTWSLIEKFNLKGLHFASYNRNQITEYQKIKYKSTSCHNLDEVKEMEGYFESVFLSPIFPSISKPGYKGNLDLDKVSNFLKKPHKTNVIGLGGIDGENVQNLQKMSFDGFALLGAIWDQKALQKEIVLEKFKNLRRCQITDPIV